MCLKVSPQTPWHKYHSQSPMCGNSTSQNSVQHQVALHPTLWPPPGLFSLHLLSRQEMCFSLVESSSHLRSHQLISVTVSNRLLPSVCALQCPANWLRDFPSCILLSVPKKLARTVTSFKLSLSIFISLLTCLAMP